jgi:RNA polymerase sigma-70 factor (ECF subfamily)
VAKGILIDEQDIEDAMQEAYIKAYRQLATFERRSAFPTWITRILINECLMKKRQITKAGAALLPEEMLLRHSDAHTPEKKVMNNELKRILEHAIATLPEKYRIVFIMREIEQMSVSETTDVLEITDGNVKARLSRAKEMLRNNLLAEYPASQLFEFNAVRCDRIVSNVFARI